MCDSSIVDDAVQHFNNLMAVVIDNHAPKIKRCIRLHKTPWWDAQCLEMLRERQSAERSLRKNKSQSNKSIYFEACKKAKRRFDVKRESFYSTKLQNSFSALRKTYLTINQPLDKMIPKL